MFWEKSGELAWNLRFAAAAKVWRA
jgi:hypothetical protein